MLVELRVENLAVIERSDARFGARFNAITGETGAGKSVLLSALGLALGARADPDLVRRGAERALASAVFEDPPAAAAETCRALGVAVEETLVLTRELSSSGRGGSRANGSIVPATALRDLGSQLVDVQGQGASSLWLREAEQRAADISVNYPSLVENYRAARVVMLRHSQSQASTEDLRLAMVNFRSLFDKLLETAKPERVGDSRERIAS